MKLEKFDNKLRKFYVLISNLDSRYFQLNTVKNKNDLKI